jgi:hypothetical protein
MRIPWLLVIFLGGTVAIALSDGAGCGIVETCKRPAATTTLSYASPAR